MSQLDRLSGAWASVRTVPAAAKRMSAARLPARTRRQPMNPDRPVGRAQHHDLLCGLDVKLSALQSASADSKKAEEEVAEFALPARPREGDPDPS
jgi:hypothetical protein